MNTKSKFCSECGAPLEESDLFCPVCGAKVLDADESDQKKSPTQKAPTPPPTSYTSENTTDKRKASTETGEVRRTARFSYKMLIYWSTVGLIGLFFFYAVLCII